MTETKKGEIVIYKTQTGPEIQVQIEGDTVWLTQAQMVELFGRDQTTISRHINNIYKEGELIEAESSLKQANMQKMHIGLDKPTTYYNLDMVISVGYRVNSKRGTQFRMWATQRLKDYLLKGYAINEKRLKDLEGIQVRLKELEQVNKLFSRVIDSKKAEGYEKDLLKIITDYTNTWFVLNQYDKGELQVQGVSKKKPSVLDYEEVKKSIAKFKQRLIEGKQAGSLFGQEVGEKFKSVLGSINQTFGSKDLYPSIEEKAAHLLYFAIKDHPFADGNKRIGSLLFLLFLVENHHLLNKKGERKINDSALTALALLIAESKPQDKEVMVRLVINLIASK
jgi:prophage maintenance system killer protein